MKNYPDRLHVLPVQPAPKNQQPFYGPGWLLGRNGTTRLRQVAIHAIPEEDMVSIHARATGEDSAIITLSYADARTLAKAMLEAATDVQT